MKSFDETVREKVLSLSWIPLNYRQDVVRNLQGMRNDDAMRALESLTPGGSEFVDDIERCVSFVRDGRTSMMDVLRSYKRELSNANHRFSSMVLHMSNEELLEEASNLQNECLPEDLFFFQLLCKEIRSRGLEVPA